MFSHQRASFDFDASLVEALFVHSPSYASYPTLDQFDGQFGPKQYQRALQQRQAGLLNRSLSLCVSVPCHHHNVGSHHDKNRRQQCDDLDQYVVYLAQELDLVGQYLAGQNQLAHIHLARSAPMALSIAQLTHIMNAIQRHFKLTAHGDYCVDLDVMQTSPSDIHNLKKLGFNRVNLVFSDDVTQHPSSLQALSVLLQAAREAQLACVGVDVGYGLPHQNWASIEAVLQGIVQCQPDRLTFRPYQEAFDTFQNKPSLVESSHQEKMTLLQWAVHFLVKQSYVFIGMGQFVKSKDALVQAWYQGRLQRNFQGYCTRADGDLLGVGVASMGKIGASYIQNETQLQRYYDRIQAGVLPVKQGYWLKSDDILRRHVIDTLMCQFGILFEVFEEQYGMVFQDYFEPEWPQILHLQSQGLLQMHQYGFDVTPKGRFVIGNIAMVFDRYLRSLSCFSAPTGQYLQAL